MATVLVSRRCHEQGARPGFVYRDDPDGEHDSGWRALVGDETEAEVDDPFSIVVAELDEVLGRWPELGLLVGTDPAVGAWSWDEQQERYVPLPTSPSAD